MNSKGFAITGIIYTLFVLFLMISLSVLSGLNSVQRLMVNSTGVLESSFDGIKISSEELVEINAQGIAPYYGKYIFNARYANGGRIVCTSYLSKGAKFSEAVFFPSQCINTSSKELIELYSFEEVD